MEPTRNCRNNPYTNHSPNDEVGYHGPKKFQSIFGTPPDGTGLSLRASKFRTTPKHQKKSWISRNELRGADTRKNSVPLQNAALWFGNLSDKKYIPDGPTRGSSNYTKIVRTFSQNQKMMSVAAEMAFEQTTAVHKSL